MNKSKLKNYKKENLDEVAIQLDILQNARFATILFMIGCFLNFIEYDYSEKAIFQSLSNDDESVINNNEIEAAEIAKAVSIIFLIAIIIFTGNALTTFGLGITNASFDRNNVSNKFSESNSNSSRIIAFSDLIKVVGYLGAAIGYSMVLEEMDNA